MTLIVEDEQGLPGVSAPLSIGALAVALAAMLLGAAAALCHWQAASLFLSLAYLTSVCGIATALLERNGRNALACFLVLALSLVVANLLLKWPEFDGRPGAVFFLGAPYALLPAIATWPLVRRGYSAPLCLLLLWLLTAALFFIFPIGWLILNDGHTPIAYRPLNLILMKLVLYQFGPWATRIAKVATYMDVGQHPPLPTALVFSAVLGAVVCISLRWRCTAPYCYIPFACLLTVWFALGIWPYANDFFNAIIH